MSTEGLDRWVEFDPAHDCIRRQPCKFGSDRCKPGEGGSHGIHNVSARWFVRGPLGAVQFVMSTGWFLDETPDMRPGLYPIPSDLGYHSPKPTYEGQGALTEDCHIIGGRCFYDGSGLNADEPWRILRYEGGDALWKFLEGYYRDTFERSA